MGRRCRASACSGSRPAPRSPPRFRRSSIPNSSPKKIDILIEGFAGRFFAVFAVSWIAAGLVLLISWGRASCGALAWICVIVSLIWGGLSYHGLVASAYLQRQDLAKMRGYCAALLIPSADPAALSYANLEKHLCATATAVARKGEYQQVCAPALERMTQEFARRFPRLRVQSMLDMSFCKGMRAGV